MLTAPERVRLRAARQFFGRVSCIAAIRGKTTIEISEIDEDQGPVWLDEFTAGISHELLEECGVDKEQLLLRVKTWWELESFVKALDSIETLASVSGLTRE